MNNFTLEALLLLICYFRGVYSGQCKLRFPPYSKGYCMRSSVCPGAVFKSLCPFGNDQIGCCVLENYPYYGGIDSNVTLEMFTAIFNNTDRSQSQYEHFLYSLRTAGATSCHQQSAYITQIAYDTNFLLSMEDLPRDFRKWSKEEFRYIGRGAIHVSGKEYYEWIKKKLHVNFVDSPEKLAFPSKAFWSAALIWTNSYSAVEKGPLSHVSYNKLADGSKYGFLLLSYYLKGKIDDMDRLLRIWKRVNKVLKCPCVKIHGPKCKVSGREGRCKYIEDCKGKQFGDFKHCKGPSDIVRCSLDNAVSVDVRIMVSENIPVNSSLLVITERIQNRIASNADSRVVITAHTSKSETSKVGQILERSSNTRIFKSTINKSHDENTITKQNKESKDYRLHRLFRRKVTVMVEKDGKNNQKNDTVFNQFNQTDLILKLSYGENHLQLTARDVLLDYELSINEPFVEERLLEKILNGPWHLKDDETRTLQLEKNETIYLAIPYQDRTDMLPFVSIDNHTGSVDITGLWTASQLPANQDYHCCKNCTNKAARMEEKRKPVLVWNPGNKSSSTTETVVSLVINSKAIVVIRGMEIENIISIKITQTRRPRTNDQGRSMLPVILSSIWTVICSFLAIVCLSTVINAAKCYQVSQKTICKVVNNFDTEEQAGRIPEGKDDSKAQQQSSKSNQSTQSKQLRSSCMLYLQISTQVIENSESFEDRRCLGIMTYIQLFRLLCIILFHITFITGATLRMSKTVCSANIFFASVASNSLYVWIVLEALLGLKLNSLVSTHFRCSSARSAVLLLSTVGIPAVLALMPIVLHKLKTTRICCWFSEQNELWMEIGVKSVLFAITMAFWFILLIKPSSSNQNNNMTHRWRTASIVTISISFTAAWALSLVSVSSSEWRIVPHMLAACNFFMGIFILISFYQQTRENVLNLQSLKENTKTTTEYDEENLASPEISRHIVYYDDSM